MGGRLNSRSALKITLSLQTGGEQRSEFQDQPCYEQQSHDKQLQKSSVAGSKDNGDYAWMAHMWDTEEYWKFNKKRLPRKTFHMRMPWPSSGDGAGVD